MSPRWPARVRGPSCDDLRRGYTLNSYLVFFQRALAAFCAMARLASAESFLARALPPRLPKALAALLMSWRFVFTTAY